MWGITHSLLPYKSVPPHSLTPSLTPYKKGSALHIVDHLCLPSPPLPSRPFPSPPLPSPPLPSPPLNRTNIKGTGYQALVTSVAQSIVFYIYAVGISFGAFLVIEERATYNDMFQYVRGCVCMYVCKRYRDGSP